MRAAPPGQNVNTSRAHRSEPHRASRFADAWGSLKLRITLGTVGALVLCIGISTALLVRQAERDTLTAERHRELDAAARTAAALSSRVVDLQRALQVTAARLSTDPLPDDDSLAAALLGQPVLRGMFSALAVADRAGRVRVLADASGVHRPEMNLSRRGYFQRTLTEQRAIISEPMSALDNGTPVIVLTYPLVRSGRLTGMLTGAMRLASRDLLGDLTGSAEAQTAALVVVTDSEGRVLSHPDPARLMHVLSEEPRMAQAFGAWTAAGSAVEPAGFHLDQANELVSAAGVPGPDWMVWRATPHAELLGPIHAARRQTLIWAILMIAAVSLATPCCSGGCCAR